MKDRSLIKADAQRIDREFREYLESLTPEERESIRKEQAESTARLLESIRYYNEVYRPLVESELAAAGFDLQCDDFFEKMYILGDMIGEPAADLTAGELLRKVRAWLQKLKVEKTIETQSRKTSDSAQHPQPREIETTGIHQDGKTKVLTKEQILNIPNANNDSSDWREWSSKKQYAERDRIPELNEHLTRLDQRTERFINEWRDLKSAVVGKRERYEARDNAAFYAVLANKFNLRPDEVANLSCITVAGFVDAIEILSKESEGGGQALEPPSELVGVSKTMLPVEHQSEPISMAEAARRLNYSTGKNDSEAGAKRVKREIKSGVLWAIQVSERKWHFDKRIVKNSD